MRLIRHVILLLCLGYGLLVSAKERLTLEQVMDWPVIAVPTVSYSPETSWAFGAAGAGYARLKSDSLHRLSEFNLHGAYSLNKQWYIHFNSTMYLTDHWQLSCKAHFRHYPDHFYGTGNLPERPFDSIYTSQQLYLMAQPLYQVIDHLHVGASAEFLYEWKGLDSATWAHWRVGAVMQYDTRNRIYYPTSGMLLKAQAEYVTHGVHAQIDFRHFVRLIPKSSYDLVFAYQFRYEGLYCSSTHPELLPTLGGDDLLRGIRAGKYRDNTLLCLQGELRIPIWRIIRADVFAGIGDVYDVHNWQWAKPKVGYGVGLRLCFNQAGVNLRADVARNNIDKDWRQLSSYSFYLTIKEAF